VVFEREKKRKKHIKVNNYTKRKRQVPVVLASLDSPVTFTNYHREWNKVNVTASEWSERGNLGRLLRPLGASQ
jgi:hypothetical protein